MFLFINSAILCEKPKVYLFWEVQDDVHEIVGIEFRYWKMKIRCSLCGKVASLIFRSKVNPYRSILRKICKIIWIMRELWRTFDPTLYELRIDMRNIYFNRTEAT